MGRPSKRATKIREGSEFDTARLRNALSSPTNGGVGPITSWSVPEILAARDAQMRGQFKLAARLAESIRTDDALFVAYCNRLDPQKCIKVEMVPASDKSAALKIAAESESLFGQEGVGFRPGAIVDIHGCLVNHSIAFGTNRMTTREDGSRVDVEHSYWPIEFVRWDAIGRRYLARVDPASVSPGDVLSQDARLGAIGSYEVEITHGDGRWVIYSNHDVEAFKQEAAIIPASSVWARRAFAQRDWAKGSLAHGSAKLVGEMPQGVPLQDANGITPEAEAMIVLLKNFVTGDSNVGIRPAGSKTEFITNTSTAWQVWKELVGDGTQSAARIYLGTDGTLGSNGGAPGVDITQLFGVAVTKVKGDLGCLERGILTGVIEPWCALNFGDSSLAPTRKYLLPDADEEAWRASLGTRRTSFFADIAAARANGFVVDQDFVDETAKTYDITAPDLPEVTDAKAPTIALAPTDLAQVIGVNEARASAGLGPLLLADGKNDPDGLMTVSQFGAKKAAEAAAAAVPPPVPASP